jgi:dTDP-4-dehydrorhamnose reductase
LNALVVGADGQLGSELVRILGADSGVTHDQASITSWNDVQGLIRARQPEVVFNCAAYNAVDAAEVHPAEAFAVNAEGPNNLAKACRLYGATLVHYSTNFVFDGAHDQPYIEADEPSPLSVYAQSKLHGERLALSSGSEVLILRTAAVYGGARGFPNRFIELARKGEPLRVVSDQWINPTLARDLAAASVDLVREGTTGVVHAVAEGCCAWDEFARAVLAEAAIQRPVQSISTRLQQNMARRPKHGCLRSTRINPLRHWREALREALNP